MTLPYDEKDRKFANLEIETALPSPTYDKSDRDYLIYSTGFTFEPEPEVGPGEVGLVPEEHRAFAKAHPNVYAAQETFWKMWGNFRQVIAPTPEEKRMIVRGITAHIPFVKYILPEKREEFWHLDQQQQTRALLYDTLETTLLLPGGVSSLFKGVGKAARLPFRIASKLKPPFKFRPVEELALKEIKPFYKEEAAVRKLKKLGIKNKEEIRAILDDDLPYLYAKQMGKKKDISTELKKVIKWEGGVPKLTEKASEALGHARLRAEHFRKEYGRIVDTIVGEGKEKDFAKKVFDSHVLKNLGSDMVGKVKLDNASTLYMANFIEDLIRHPRIAKGLAEMGEYAKLMPDVFSPVRIVFGTMEKRFQAFSRIYKPISKALERRNSYMVEKILTMMQMFKDRGLGTWKYTKVGGLKFTPAFTKEEVNAAYKASLKLDELASLRKKVPILDQEMKMRATRVMEELPENSRKILLTQNDYFDHLYAEHFLEKIPQIFEEVGLSARGEIELGVMMEKVGANLSRIFSKTGKFQDHRERYRVLKGMLTQIRKTLNHPNLAKDGTHPWFEAKAKDLAKSLQDARKNLTIRGGRFADYKENYVARIGKRHKLRSNSWNNRLVGELHAGYTNPRKDVFTGDVVESFEQMIQARTRAQANELFLYPEIGRAVEHAVTLPKHVRQYTDHYISRLLGRSSDMDGKVARFLDKTVGRLTGQTWSADRVDNLARRLNDLGLLGGLAFKPFSAMRNLFQPLITVPADLGGLKGFGNLLQGFYKTLDPNFRKYVQSIGGIQEYAPELYLQQRLLPFGKAARWDQIRDVGMWMFSGSDRLSRYMAGGAAYSKWEAAVSAIGKENLLTPKGLVAFSRKAGLRGRYPWVRTEIEGLLERGAIDEAKATFINDVIADTQYLYRVGESPIIGQRGGAIGKTGALFQSWWMNYGTLLEKWFRTGDASTKVARTFTWMTSSAIAMTIMEQMWGTKSALRDTFLGPFPTTINRFILPPAWAPIADTITLIGAIPPALIQGEPEKLASHGKSLLRSLTFFIPGSLQIRAMAEGLKEGGPKGLAQSIIRYQRARGFKPWFQEVLD